MLHVGREVGVQDDVHAAGDVHLALERQPDVGRDLAAAAIGADHVLGADGELGAGDPIAHLDGDAVVVLGEAGVLRVEADPATARCRVSDDDRLEQGLRDVAVG
jgi:hypothetical protein